MKKIALTIVLTLSSTLSANTMPPYEKETQSTFDNYKLGVELKLRELKNKIIFIESRHSSERTESEIIDIKGHIAALERIQNFNSSSIEAMHDSHWGLVHFIIGFLSVLGLFGVVLGIREIIYFKALKKDFDSKLEKINAEMQKALVQVTNEFEKSADLELLYFKEKFRLNSLLKETSVTYNDIHPTLTNLREYPRKDFLVPLVKLSKLEVEKDIRPLLDEVIQLLKEHSND